MLKQCVLLWNLSETVTYDGSVLLLLLYTYLGYFGFLQHEEHRNANICANENDEYKVYK